MPPGKIALPRHEARPLRRLTLMVTLEDLGEVSFYPFIILLAALALTPLGTAPASAAILGLGIAGLGLQLVMRYPHMLLPEAVRTVLNTNQLLQRATQWYANLEPRRTSTGRTSGHWIASRPFDLVPKLMIIGCGAALPFSIHVPYMPGTLALAAILLCAGLALRSALVITFGAMMISASSVLPTFFS